MKTYYNSISFVNTVAAYFVNDYFILVFISSKRLPGIKARFLTASKMYHKEVRVKDHCAFIMDLFFKSQYRLTMIVSSGVMQGPNITVLLT
jgi:hypothetical protein